MTALTQLVLSHRLSLCAFLLQVSTLQAQLAEAEHSRRLLGQGPLACQAGPSLGLAAFSAGVKVCKFGLSL